MSPFVTLPKAPTLPHNYATLPSTLPPSILSSPPTNSQVTRASSDDPESQLPAYVTSASGFRAHPSSIISQNRALRDGLVSSSTEARKTFQGWLDAIKERELAEKRRKAPGWLDSDEKMLRPARAGQAKEEVTGAVGSLLDTDDNTRSKPKGEDADVNDLGVQMDRAFG